MGAHMIFQEKAQDGWFKMFKSPKYDLEARDILETFEEIWEFCNTNAGKQSLFNHDDIETGVCDLGTFYGDAFVNWNSLCKFYQLLLQDRRPSAFQNLKAFADVQLQFFTGNDIES